MNLSTGLHDLLERLSTETMLADGAMGTMLHTRGTGFEKCFDELNLTQPSAVAEIHRAYIEAGAQLIITNTFGANRFKANGREEHGLQNKPGRWDWRKDVVSASSRRCCCFAGEWVHLGVRIDPLDRVNPSRRVTLRRTDKALQKLGEDLM